MARRPGDFFTGRYLFSTSKQVYLDTLKKIQDNQIDELTINEELLKAGIDFDTIAYTYPFDSPELRLKNITDAIRANNSLKKIVVSHLDFLYTEDGDNLDKIIKALENHPSIEHITINPQEITARSRKIVNRPEDNKVTRKILSLIRTNRVMEELHFTAVFPVSTCNLLAQIYANCLVDIYGRPVSNNLKKIHINFLSAVKLPDLVALKNWNYNRALPDVSYAYPSGVLDYNISANLRNELENARDQAEIQQDHEEPQLDEILQRVCVDRGMTQEQMDATLRLQERVRALPRYNVTDDRCETRSGVPIPGYAPMAAASASASAVSATSAISSATQSQSSSATHAQSASRSAAAIPAVPRAAQPAPFLEADMQLLRKAGEDEIGIKTLLLSLKCPILNDITSDPVMLHGRIYDRNSLQNWLNASPYGRAKDPMDNSVFTARDIITPWAIRDQIQKNIELIKERQKQAPAAAAVESKLDEPVQLEPELEDSENKNWCRIL